ncbi:DUF2808 domain-containing protein [Cyanobacterium sp. IPPAS B-1200]|uniref:DUF2808 domain-containing protein n=1 Tax=Cyanobacterium sp. IPPAS B-1200 TaxID=1562720 RepID=UPI0008526E67|nr:DUF2808 domain-containing protein [Cyanobacterium sp. IPPAS B-1200]OEJ79864.1 hypothetical protein A5482_08360 [Cyanobacterium sp. IPPAS B-1200]
MKPFKLTTKRLMAALAISTSFLLGIPYMVMAQGQGLVLFSGIERENLLRRNFDFGNRAGNWERYRLTMPGDRLTDGVSRLYVTYPESFTGKFDTDAIEVRLNNQALPLQEVIWDKESSFIEIVLEEPFLETRDLEIVMSNVYNPRFGGTFYFHGQTLSAGQVPIRLYVGTWIVTVN